MNAHRAKKR